jgi:hypothetical protein
MLLQVRLPVDTRRADDPHVKAHLLLQVGARSHLVGGTAAMCCLVVPQQSQCFAVLCCTYVAVHISPTLDTCRWLCGFCFALASNLYLACPYACMLLPAALAGAHVQAASTHQRLRHRHTLNAGQQRAPGPGVSVDKVVRVQRTGYLTWRHVYTFAVLCGVGVAT